MKRQAENDKDKDKGKKRESERERTIDRERERGEEEKDQAIPSVLSFVCVTKLSPVQHNKQQPSVPWVALN